MDRAFQAAKDGQESGSCKKKKKMLDKQSGIWYNKYRKNEREEIKNDDGRDEKRDDGSYENHEKSV